MRTAVDWKAPPIDQGKGLSKGLRLGKISLSATRTDRVGHLSETGAETIRADQTLIVAYWLALALAAFFAFRGLDFGNVVAAGVVAGIVALRGRDLPLMGFPNSEPRRGPRIQIAINVGGGLIPVCIAVQQAVRLPRIALGPFLATTTAIAGISYFLARPVAGRGVVMAWFLPSLSAAALALVLEPGWPAAFAFASSTLGTLVGADLLHLPGVLRRGPAGVSIGGDGPFDGLLWSGLLASVMAGGVS